MLRFTSSRFVHILPCTTRRSKSSINIKIPHPRNDHDFTRCSFSVYPHHCRALWNSWNHGPTPLHFLIIFEGYQLLLSTVTTRSGWGINASTRPFGVCTPVIPPG